MYCITPTRNAVDLTYFNTHDTDALKNTKIDTWR